MQQTEGFNDKSGRVCLLNKALYGLKQLGREWEQFLRELLAKYGLVSQKIEQSIYIRRDSNDILIVLAYVDDLIVINRKKEAISKLYLDLSKDLILKDLGEA